MSQAVSDPIINQPSPKSEAAPKLTRRVLLAGAVAGLVAPGRSDKAAASAEDPILALVEAERTAKKAHSEADDSYNAIIARHFPEGARFPHAVVGYKAGKPVWARSAIEIERIFDIHDARAMPSFTAPKVSRQEVLADLNAKVARIARLEETSGLNHAKKYAEIRDEEWGAAKNALLDASPTTPEGSAALATFLVGELEYELLDCDDMVHRLLSKLKDSLLKNSV